MLRMCIRLPKDVPLQQYDHWDLIHDAIINALIDAGAKPHEIIGVEAKPWNYAPLGWHNKKIGCVHSIIISTPDSKLAPIISRINPKLIKKSRANCNFHFDFSSASKFIEPDPVLPNQKFLSCMMLSPLALGYLEPDQKTKRWYRHFEEAKDSVNLIVNKRLTKISGREVKLEIHPDPLYIRATPKHSVLVNLKMAKNGKQIFVIGIKAPFVLTGSEDDLRLAWYAGIGERTRYGFGCIGLIDLGSSR